MLRSNRGPAIGLDDQRTNRHTVAIRGGLSAPAASSVERGVALRTGESIRQVLRSLRDGTSSGLFSQAAWARSIDDRSWHMPAIWSSHLLRLFGIVRGGVCAAGRRSRGGHAGNAKGRRICAALSRLRVVEMGGIEPPSRNFRRGYTPGKVENLVLPTGRPSTASPTD